jgi:hypothetical protein
MEDFLEGLSSIERRESILESGDQRFPVRYKKGKKEGLLVIFNGWEPLRDYDVNISSYHGWKQLQGLGYSILYFSQPILGKMKISHSLSVLYRSLNRERNPIFNAIKATRNTLGLSNQDIIFHGKSSGCNSAFLLSLKFPRSKSILVNPETNPFSQDESLRRLVWEKLRTELPENIPRLKNAANLVVATASHNVLPNVYIYQNNCDLEYLEKQTKPLIDVINSALSSGTKGSLTVEYCSSSLGHSSEMDVNTLRSVTAMLGAKKYTKDTGNNSKKVVYLRQSSMNVELGVMITRINPALDLGSSNLVVSYSDYSSEVIPIDFADGSGIQLTLSDKVNNTVITKVELDMDCQPVSEAIKVEIEEYILGLDGS